MVSTFNNAERINIRYGENLIYKLYSEEFDKTASDSTIRSDGFQLEKQ